MKKHVFVENKKSPIGVGDFFRCDNGGEIRRVIKIAGRGRYGSLNLETGEVWYTDAMTVEQVLERYDDVQKVEVKSVSLDRIVYGDA